MRRKYIAPRVTKVSGTPFEFVVLKWAMSDTERCAARRAPPAKPMMANPVAMPGRSGNHLIRVEIGEI
jgi:hypothetical protein